MVVLAASICTRGGKAVLSRQFREMPKSRIEALLASFPKLTSEGTQHTSVETESVRYVYQPLEEMYMVLITTKRSNILQDIDTLHLFAQVVSSVCRGSLDEREIMKNAFELLSAFDEIVCLGYKENLTLPQVKNILEMESHEEKIQEIIARNKEHEASEERKRRARQLEMQRREMAKFGPRQTSGGFSSNFGSQYQSVRSSSPDVAATSHYDSYKAETSKKPALAPMKGKGMQLGKKQNTRLYDALSNEIASVEEPAIAASPVAETSHARVPSTSSTEGIQIALSENTTWKVNRDGGVEGLDVQGQLNLFIADGSMSRIQLALNSSDSDGTVFKTHPNVDRNLFKDQHKIGLRDSSRPFPLNQQMSVLRWRLQSKGDSGKLPISVNMWPSPVGDGTTDVSIEYEVDGGTVPEDLLVVIPMPIPGSIPQVKEIDGDYQVSAAGFEWRPPVDEVENGRLEFNIAGDDAEGFFPVRVQYNTAKMVCSVDVTDVKLVDMAQEVPFAHTIKAESVIDII